MNIIDDTNGTVYPLILEKLAALVPLPRLHVVRYGGCLAPHRPRRRLITPTPRQHGAEAPAAGSAAPSGSWARLLKRVFAVDLARGPACGRGTLRLSAALTHAEVIRTMLRHLTRATDPPPIAPARACPAPFAWASPSPDVSSHVPWEQGMAEVRLLRVMRAACGERERV